MVKGKKLCSMILNLSLILGILGTGIVAQAGGNHDFTIFAGIGSSGFSGDGANATEAELNQPEGIVCDSEGNIYFSDYQNNRIRKIDKNGIINTVAGTGSNVSDGVDEGNALEMAIPNPSALAIDSSNNIYILCNEEHKVKSFNTKTGVAKTVAGNGAQGEATEGGLAIESSLGLISTIALDSDENLYLADEGFSCIRKIETAGFITTLDNGIADDLEYIKSIKFKDGVMYLLDSEKSFVRSVNLQNMEVGIVAGIPDELGDDPDAMIATETLLNHPKGMAINGKFMYIADSLNCKVRRVNLETGYCTTIISNIGDGIFTPADLCVGQDDYLYVTDYDNNVIRKADLADREAPTVTDKEIIVSDINRCIAEIDFEKAEDDISVADALIYKVYYSKSSKMDTVEDIEKNGKLSEDFDVVLLDAVILDKTLIDYEENTTYYINIIVEDEWGNKACYDKTSVTTDPKPKFGKVSAGFDSINSIKVDFEPTVDGEKEFIHVAFLCEENVFDNLENIDEYMEEGDVKAAVALDGKTARFEDVECNKTYYILPIVGEKIYMHLYDVIEVAPINGGNFEVEDKEAKVNKSTDTAIEIPLNIKLTSFAEDNFNIVKFVTTVSFNNNMFNIDETDLKNNIKLSKNGILSSLDNVTVYGLVKDGDTTKFNIEFESDKGILASSGTWLNFVPQLRSTASEGKTTVEMTESLIEFKDDKGSNYELTIPNTNVEVDVSIPKKPKDSSGSSDRSRTQVKIEAIRYSYMGGYADGTFNPDGNITRAEIAAIISRLSPNFIENKSYENKFSDIGKNEWYAKFIGFISSQNIVSGYENGTFNPDGNITRAEFAAIVSRFRNLDTNTVKIIPLNDIQSHWAEKYISAVYTAGAIIGYEDNTFKPDENISRAEAVKIINAIMGRVPNKSNVDANLSKYTAKYKDVGKEHWAYYDIIVASTTHNFGEF